MSAGSRKKHSNAHKGFQGGSDHLEVQSLLAGAGNGRDVEQRLGGGKSAPEEVIDPAVLAALEKQAAQPSGDPDSGQEALSIGNEGPVSAGNADTPNNSEQEEKNMSRLSQAFLSPETLDAALKAPRPELDMQSSGPIGYIPADRVGYVPNMPHQGRNLIAIVTRGVKADLFSPTFSDIVKHMFELAPQSITGLTTGFRKLDRGESLEDLVSEPVIGVVERKGRVFDKVLTEWARRYNDYLLDKKKQVPASQRALAIQESDVTIGLFFIEPDDTGTKVLAAWEGTNVYPSYYPGIGSMRNLHGRIDEYNLTVGLGGQFRRGESVLAAAQKELDKLVAQQRIEPSTLVAAINAKANG